MTSPLLLAQLRRHLDLAENDLAPSDRPVAEVLAAALRGAPLERLAALVDEVDRSYLDAEQQNARLHRALEVSTLEAAELTDELRAREAFAETARQASEGRFQAIMDLLPDIVSVLETDGTLAYNSPACARIHGWTPAELVGRRTFDLIHPDDRDRVGLAMAEVLGRPGTTVTTEYRYQNKDGSFVWMEATASNHLDDPGVRGVVAVSRDISERRAASELLRESEARYRNLSDLFPIPVFEADLDGRLLFANEALRAVFGAEHANPGASLIALFAPTAQGPLLRHLRRPDGAGPLTDELTGRRADGSALPVELTSAVVTREGVPVGVRGAMVDLTDRHRVLTEMVRVQKLESIGLLAGGIAHDFNNILTGIRGNVSLASSLAGTWSPLQEVLAETEQATQRATELTRQLLTFARGGAPTLRPVGVERLCREVTSFVLRGSSLRAELDIAPGLPDLLADEGQLAQALGNLLINAREAMPGGGTVRVSATVAPLPASSPRSGLVRSAVRIRVSDDGPGIPEDILPRIFDPYFTTKASGHGLGLASAYSIIRRHGGELRAESSPGRGATFELLLPAAPGRAAGDPVSSQRATPPPPELHGRVLVMDDEVMILRLVQSALTRVGLEVDLCGDGLEAVAAYRAAAARGAPYDLVIMDLTIPGGVGGREAASAIHELDPTARLVVSSGYSDDPILANHQDHGFVGTIPKPYSASDLVSAVRQLIASAA